MEVRYESSVDSHAWECQYCHEINRWSNNYCNNCEKYNYTRRYVKKYGTFAFLIKFLRANNDKRIHVIDKNSRFAIFIAIPEDTKHWIVKRKWCI